MHQPANTSHTTCLSCRQPEGCVCVFQIFKKVGWVALRLLLVPGLIEAFFDGGLAVALFGMPTTFAFALGFILKAVGPALVIQCMFDVQQKRLGTAKGWPSCCCSYKDTCLSQELNSTSILQRSNSQVCCTDGAYVCCVCYSLP